MKNLDLISLFVLGLYKTSTLLTSSPSSILVFVLVGLDSSRLYSLLLLFTQGLLFCRVSFCLRASLL